MKLNILFSAITALAIVSCSSDVTPQDECEYYATVVDMTGLDGCGFLLQTPDGKRYEPVWRWGFCGTPPLPEGMKDDPLLTISFYHGQKVKFSFRPSESASICMAGTPVIITCITEVESVSPNGVSD